MNKIIEHDLTLKSPQISKREQFKLENIQRQFLVISSLGFNVILH